MFAIGERYVSQYPPGWSAILAAGELVRLPAALVNPLIGVVTVAATFRFAARQYGRAVAVIAVVILVTGSFFIFNSASFYNHSIMALLGVLFAGAAAEYLDGASVRSAAAMGLWFSALAVVRHFDAVVFAAPVLVVMLRHPSLLQWKLVPVAAMAALPLFVLLLIYYARVTGHPLVVPQTLNDPNDGLLGARWHIAQATEILAGRFVELAEWVSPPFVVALGWALWAKLRGGTLRFFDIYAPLFLIGYWFYWGNGGYRWGPRYIYACVSLHGRDGRGNGMEGMAGQAGARTVRSFGGAVDHRGAGAGAVPVVAGPGTDQPGAGHSGRGACRRAAQRRGGGGDIYRADLADRCRRPRAQRADPGWRRDLCPWAEPVRGGHHARGYRPGRTGVAQLFSGALDLALPA